MQYSVEQNQGEMSCLNSGVLVRLLEEMNDEETGCEDRKPALLQIRSIVPVLSEGNLWPNQGFSLRVADASHTMYVSLPQEQDELILCNKLQIGQFIYADRMEASYPVPVLRGIRPAPARHSYVGATKDLGSVDNLVEISGKCDPESRKYVSSDLEGIQKPQRKPRAKPCSSSPSRAGTSPTGGGRVMNRSSRDGRSSDSEDTRGFDKESDSDSTVSTVSSVQITRRRSWNEADSQRTQEISASPLLRHKLRPVALSAVRRRQDNYSGKSSPKTLRKELILASKSHKISKSRISGTPKRQEVPTDPATLFGEMLNRKRTEDTILWGSLPSELVKLGKEVVRKRDAALLASAEALQEASAAERLIKCLSSYSELQSTYSEGERPSVDNFFNLQDNLIQSRLILKSLETEENDLDSPKPCKEARQIALDRKRNAELWVKAATKADLLVPSPTAVKPGEEQKRCPPSVCNEYHWEQAGEVSEKRIQEWQRGNSLVAATNLVSCLQAQLHNTFLAYVEQYLDELKSSLRMDSNNEIVGVMLRIKRVSDWLDAMVKKDAGHVKIGSRESLGGLGESVMLAYGRVRNKIYRILLMHIERSAAAREEISSASSQD